MRAAVLLLAAAAVVQASSVVDTTLTVTECGPLVSTNSSWSVEPTKNLTSLPTSPNATATTTDIVMAPSETSRDPAIPTAGAISQPLQSSMVGLLGFMIVGLILV